MNIIINPKYAELESFVRSLPDNFVTLPCERVLRDIRNSVRLVRAGEHLVVVKSFRKLSLVNRFAYGRLRESKAVRAYKYALRLQELGIGTPEPIAAIDVRRNGLISGSYFVSLYSDYISMETINNCAASTICPLLNALTDFMIRMHDRGVVHNDLNISNILYKELPMGGYDFQIVDINRMEFRRSLSKQERLSNMSKFECSPEAYFYILGHYANQGRYDQDEFQMRGMMRRMREVMRHRFKVNCREKLKR